MFQINFSRHFAWNQLVHKDHWTFHFSPRTYNVYIPCCFVKLNDWLWELRSVKLFNWYPAAATPIITSVKQSAIPCSKGFISAFDRLIFIFSAIISAIISPNSSMLPVASSSSFPDSPLRLTRRVDEDAGCTSSQQAECREIFQIVLIEPGVKQFWQRHDFAASEAAIDLAALWPQTWSEPQSFPLSQ